MVILLKLGDVYLLLHQNCPNFWLYLLEEDKHLNLNNFSGAVILSVSAQWLKICSRIHNLWVMMHFKIRSHFYGCKLCYKSIEKVGHSIDLEARLFLESVLYSHVSCNMLLLVNIDSVMCNGCDQSWHLIVVITQYCQQSHHIPLSLDHSSLIIDQGVWTALIMRGDCNRWRHKLSLNWISRYCKTIHCVAQSR